MTKLIKVNENKDQMCKLIK